MTFAWWTVMVSGKPRIMFYADPATAGLVMDLVYAHPGIDNTQASLWAHVNGVWTFVPEPGHTR